MIQVNSRLAIDESEKREIEPGTDPSLFDEDKALQRALAESIVSHANDALRRSRPRTRGSTCRSPG